ncbi:MAG TPA: redoxin domain-containing protein, partial [Kofleriaceae bacterium]|nr:redoxin domain-containing protein [Kofleriaceae bacterium]
RFDFAAFAGHLGHQVARDPERGVWSFGPAADRSAAASSGPVMAPDFQLPDLDGNLHALSDYRGKKVLLYCWASW